MIAEDHSRGKPVLSLIERATPNAKFRHRFLFFVPYAGKSLLPPRFGYTLKPCSRYHFSAPGWSGTSRGVASVFSPSWPMPV